VTGAGLTQVLQIAVAVHNLDDAVRRYADRYGIGPWRVLDCTPADIREMEIHGQPREYSMRIALCSFGGVDWELLEPSDEHSIYAEFLRDQGEGLHHVGFDTPEWESSMRLLNDLGVPVRMRGNWGGRQEYRYLGTEADLGFLTEVFHTSPGFVHPEPAEVYPAADKAAALRPLFSAVRGVAVVVQELAPFVERYRDRYGFAPWRCWRSPGFPGRKAVCRIGGIQWALIQPDRKRSKKNPYLDFLEDHGGGLHHVVVEASDFRRALEVLRERRVSVHATGDWLDDRPLLYADTRRDLRCALELLIPPSADLRALRLQVPSVAPAPQPL
jgi:methylmalonyl-CoA/ethylmalonyl-CoA epimerase